MAMWDDLTGWLRRVRGKAAAKATRLAAEEAAREAKAKLTEAGGALLDGAEAELDRARQAREGRPGVAPSREDADAIAAKVLAAAAESRKSEQALRPPPAPPKQAAVRAAPEAIPEAPPEDPDARARAELARLKADLHKRLYGDSD